MSRLDTFRDNIRNSEIDYNFNPKFIQANKKDYSISVNQETNSLTPSEREDTDEDAIVYTSILKERKISTDEGVASIETPVDQPDFAPKSSIKKSDRQGSLPLRTVSRKRSVVNLVIPLAEITSGNEDGQGIKLEDHKTENKEIAKKKPEDIKVYRTRASHNRSVKWTNQKKFFDYSCKQAIDAANLIEIDLNGGKSLFESKRGVTSSKLDLGSETMDDQLPDLSRGSMPVKAAEPLAERPSVKKSKSVLSFVRNKKDKKSKSNSTSNKKFQISNVKSKVKEYCIIDVTDEDPDKHKLLLEAEHRPYAKKSTFGSGRETANQLDIFDSNSKNIGGVNIPISYISSRLDDMSTPSNMRRNRSGSEN